MRVFMMACVMVRKIGMVVLVTAVVIVVLVVNRESPAPLTSFYPAGVNEVGLSWRSRAPSLCSRSRPRSTSSASRKLRRGGTRPPPEPRATLFARMHPERTSRVSDA